MVDKIRKIVVLGVFLILSCGCSATYNIEITKDNIKEEIIVNEQVSTDRNATDIMSTYNSWYPVYYDEDETMDSLYTDKLDGVKYYDKKYEINNNGYVMNYTFNHNIKDYKRSFLLQNAYNKYNVDYSNNYLTLNTNSVNNYLKYRDLFDSLTVKIVTDLYVVSNNADTIEDNCYIWNFDKKSNLTKRLDFKVSFDEDSENEEVIVNDNKKDNKNYYFIILGIVVVYIIGMIVLINVKRK